MEKTETTHRPDALPNALLFAAGADELPGAIVRLRAGASVPVDGKVVWFPLGAVVRCESGHGLFGGWIDRSGAVGLLEAFNRPDDQTSWVVQKEGDALSVPTAFVDALIDRSPRFSRAVMQWLAQGAVAAREATTFNASATAAMKVGRLIGELLHHHDGEAFMTQETIAALTGVQRTTANAVLKTMKAKGLIRYSRGKISRSPTLQARSRSPEQVGSGFKGHA